MEVIQLDVQYMNIDHIESLFSSILRNQDYRKKEVEDREIVRKVRNSDIDIDEL